MSDDKPRIGVLKKHKNGFLDLIEEAYLDPQQFHTGETYVAGTKGFVLYCSGSPFRFGLIPSEDNLKYYRYAYTLLAPSFPTSQVLPNLGWHDIDQVYSQFSVWIEEHLKPYLEDLVEPDLWAQIQSQTPVVSDGPVESDDREHFTQPEQDQIQMAIKEFRQIIVEKHAPSDARLELIDNRLEYLLEQAPKLNRINWRSVALTTLIGIIIQLTLSTEQGKELFELGQRIFSNILPLPQ